MMSWYQAMSFTFALIVTVIVTYPLLASRVPFWRVGDVASSIRTSNVG